MKRRPLRIPAVLAVTLGGASAIVAAASISCGGDDGEMMQSCSIYCFEGITDAGVPPDGGCPLCADVTSGTPVCPSGCTPLG